MRFDGISGRPPPAGSILVGAGRPLGRWRWSEHLDSLLVFLEPELVERVAAEEFDLDPARVSLPPLDGLHLPQLRASMLAVNDELTADAAGGRLAVESLANLLAVHLIRNASAPRPPAGRTYGALPRGKLRAAVEYIEDHLDISPSLERMAAAAHLSPYHFARDSRPPPGCHRISLSSHAASSGPSNSWKRTVTSHWQQSGCVSGSRIRASSPITSSASSASRRANSAGRKNHIKGRKPPQEPGPRAL